MSVAENPRAVVGSNSAAFGMDEKVPPKAQRLITVEEVNAVLRCAKLLSALLKVPKKEILEKRKGGDTGRGIRRSLIYYLHGRGYPVWKIAAIIEINRKQVGEELVRFMAELTWYAELEDQNERVTRMLDDALEIDVQEFLDWIEIAASAEREERQRRKEEEAEAKPTPSPPKPKKRAPDAIDALQEEIKARRRLDYIEQQIKIHLAVIAKAAEKGASRDARKNAQDAAAELETLATERKSLRTQLKPAKAKAKLS